MHLLDQINFSHFSPHSVVFEVNKFLRGLYYLVGLPLCIIFDLSKVSLKLLKAVTP